MEDGALQGGGCGHEGDADEGDEVADETALDGGNRSQESVAKVVA